MRHIPLCRWLHFLAFVLLTILPLGAQSYRGRVLEAQTQLPVVGAKVLLFARDTTFLSGTTTDSLGYFGLDYQQGTQPAYLLSVRAVGYETLWSDLHAPHEYSLHLTPVSRQLDSVVIQAPQAVIQRRSDRLVINVKDAPDLARSSSVYTLMDRLPMIYVQGSDLHYLGHVGRTEVYIDGRIVQDLSELRSYRPEEVKKIEIVDAPSSRYGADVQSVVLIYTHRRQDEVALDATQYVELQRRLSSYTDASLAYAQGSLYCRLNLNYSRTALGTNSEDFIEAHYRGQLHQVSNRVPVQYTGDYVKGSLTLAKKLGEDTHVGVNLRMTWGNLRNEMPQAVLHYLRGGVRSFADTTHSVMVNKPLKIFVNAYVNHKWGATEMNITNDFLVGNTSNAFDYREHGSTKEAKSRGHQSFITNTLLLSLSSQFGDFSLGYGGEYAFTQNEDRNEEWYTGQQGQGSRPVSSLKRQHLLAGYADLSRVLGAWTLRAGLRYEYASPIYRMGGRRIRDIRDQHTLVPSLLVAWQAPHLPRLSLHYRRLVQRPSYGSLKDFRSYENRYVYQQGNSRLGNELSDAVTLSSSYRGVQLSLSYTHIQNSAMGIYYLTENIYGGANEFAVLKRLEDLRRSTQLSASLYWRGEYKAQTLSLQGNIQRRTYLYGGEYLTSQPYWQVEGSDYITLSEALGISLSLGYSSRTKTPFQWSSPQWSYSVGADYQIGNFSLDLTVSNLFLTPLLRSGRSFHGIHAWSVESQDRSGVSLTVSYQLRDLRPSYQNRHSGSEAQRL